MARMCEVCRQPIDPDRAEAIPETRLCTEHAREIQAYGGEFVDVATWRRRKREIMSRSAN